MRVMKNFQNISGRGKQKKTYTQKRTPYVQGTDKHPSTKVHSEIDAGRQQSSVTRVQSFDVLKNFKWKRW